MTVSHEHRVSESCLRENGRGHWDSSNFGLLRCRYAIRNNKLLGTSASLLGERTLLVAPGLATSNKKLLVAASILGTSTSLFVATLLLQTIPTNVGLYPT